MVCRCPYGTLPALFETGATVVVLTALAEERRAVHALLATPQTWTHPAGTRYDLAALPTPGWHVALGSIGRGNRAAAALTERSIATFTPVAVLLVGIAGALRRDIAIGDVVVATEVYAIHGGRDDTDLFRLRPKSWEAPHGLLQLAEQLGTDQSWLRMLPNLARPSPPVVHFRAIAAGDVVLNSDRSTLARSLRDQYNDAAAIDTEDAGAAQAGHLHLATPVLVVRGISDEASDRDTIDRDTTDRSGFRHIAAANAAAFAVTLATQLAADTAATYHRWTAPPNRSNTHPVAR